MSDDRLTYHIEFYGTEADLFRTGYAAYLVMLAKKATNALEAEGAIGPFEFWCRPADGCITPHVMCASEQ